MKLDGKHAYMHVYNWFLQQHEYYIKDESKLKTVKKPEPEGDSIRISDKARRQLKNEYIEKSLDSGEPMTGVTYEEYCDYYYDKHGYHDKDNMRREYRQALRGDNISLKNKEWRTNPAYRVPQRLFSSPEVTEDREAALEKFRSGEELAEWESRLLSTFPDAEEGCRRCHEAQIEIETRNFQNTITSAISDLGIEFSDDDEIRFEIWGHEMTVSGTLDEEKIKKLQEKLEKWSAGLQYVYHNNGHMNEARLGGFELIYLQDAENYLKEAGGGSVFDIGRDKDGNFTGLPGSLGEFIKENAIGKFGFVVDEKYKDRKDDIEKALYMREAFNSAIETVKQGNYNKLRSMTSHLTYKNGVLSC